MFTKTSKILIFIHIICIISHLTFKFLNYKIAILMFFKACGRSLLWNWLLKLILTGNLFKITSKPTSIVTILANIALAGDHIFQVLGQYSWVLPQYLRILLKYLGVLSRWIQLKSLKKSLLFDFLINDVITARDVIDARSIASTFSANAMLV